MNALSAGNLQQALAKFGENSSNRDAILTLLKNFERNCAVAELNAREEITGPIVDALFSTAGELSRTLESGLEFHFVYRSKIARDFVMADDPVDHVWEPQTTKLLLSLGATADQAAIGGAYFGDHAIPLAHVMKARSGKCHCFELNAEQIALLRKNVRINRLDNVITNEIGLWNKDDGLLTLSGADSHAAPREVVNANPSGNSFQTTTLNSYGRSAGLSRIDIIMLDIEGGELAALQGASNYLKQPADTSPAVIFEVHRSYVDWSNGLQHTDIVQLLEEHGYSVYAIRDYQSNVQLKGYPVEVIPAREVYLEGPPHGFNMLAVKSVALLERHRLIICHGVSPKLLFHRDPRLHHPLHKP
jgi:FkbM family methyltransferase